MSINQTRKPRFVVFQHKLIYRHVGHRFSFSLFGEDAFLIPQVIPANLMIFKNTILKKCSKVTVSAFPFNSLSILLPSKNIKKRRIKAVIYVYLY